MNLHILRDLNDWNLIMPGTWMKSEVREPF